VSSRGWSRFGRLLFGCSLRQHGVRSVSASTTITNMFRPTNSGSKQHDRHRQRFAVACRSTRQREQAITRHHRPAVMRFSCRLKYGGICVLLTRTVSACTPFRPLVLAHKVTRKISGHHEPTPAFIHRSARV
jgi:hypothetical protein